jgi:acetyltransferase-like isoleucine patch superfamily enzyme
MSGLVHHLADVQTNDLGEGTKVWQFVVILQGAHIGRDCNINAHCLIESDVVIGDRVTVKCGVYLWNGVRVEDDVFIGPNATFTNDKHPRSKRYPRKFQVTTIKRGASIGANATILGGVTVGEGALIGAGSVVTRDVPAGELWMGNPAVSRGAAPDHGPDSKARRN